MPLTSASSAASRQATVFQFLPALARRRLAERVGPCGSVELFRTSDGVFTVIHRRPEEDGPEIGEARIAQMRPTAPKSHAYRLFWKKGNGRWTSYCAEGSEAFVGSVDQCLAEIARDPFGCYWS